MMAMLDENVIQLEYYFVILMKHTQYPEQVNVLAGIIGDHIIAPFITDSNLNDNNYLALLKNNDMPTFTNVYYHDPANPQVPANISQQQKEIYYFVVEEYCVFGIHNIDEVYQFSFFPMNIIPNLDFYFCQNNFNLWLSK